ncbi:hypothetical protein [Cohnella boryungensis]|uniref:DUF98 domain-containing protein n=1 Tax=Cohnella boryungensis TaxID=768479 RepID=A0ABV8SFT0_9BACL
MQAELQRFKKLVFQLLLASENRTTDMLELVLQDSLIPRVLSQSFQENRLPEVDPQGKDILLRESCLLAERSGMQVSQNIAVIYPQQVPEDVYDRISQKREGIGHMIRAGSIANGRSLLRCGWREGRTVVDLFGNPYELLFREKFREVPYKEYTITFAAYESPGIHLLEYFNPRLLEAVPIQLPESPAAIGTTPGGI